MHNRAAEPKPRGAVEETTVSILGQAVEHRCGKVAQALLTVAAVRRPRKRHMIANRETGNPRTQLLDDSGALVPRHHGARYLHGAIEHVEVVGAHARGVQPHPHLARTGPVELEIDHPQRRCRRPAAVRRECSHPQPFPAGIE